MHYAFLVVLMCSGFECQIDIIQQWQSDSLREVVLQCTRGEREHKQATCLFDSEEI